MRGDRRQLQHEARELRLGLAARATRPHRVQAIRDLLLDGWRRHLVARVPLEMHLAALMRGIREVAVDRLDESRVFVRHRVLDTGESALDEVIEHRAPAGAGLTRAEPQAQMLPIAVAIHADHPQRRRGAQLAFAAHALDVGIDHQLPERFGAE